MPRQKLEHFRDDEMEAWDGFGRRLQQAREAAEMTRGELTEKVGCGREYIRKCEGGQYGRGVWMPILVRMSRVLDVNIHWLLTGELGWIRPGQVKEKR